MGWGGGGGNRQVNRYDLILPARRVFPFFGVTASLRDDSSLRRFAFDRRKCLIESPT